MIGFLFMYEYVEAAGFPSLKLLLQHTHDDTFAYSYGAASPSQTKSQTFKSLQDLCSGHLT
jgi:hypothetical protein